MRPFVRKWSAATTKFGLLGLYLGANLLIAWGLINSQTVLITRTVLPVMDWNCPFACACTCSACAIALSL